MLLPKQAAARTFPEYTAAEAPKHIGEKATVMGKVECITAGRTYHALELAGCRPTSPFWIIVNDDASGTDLNIQDLKGVTIAVTGKIERQDTQPWIVVKSTTQIQPRSALHTDHINRESSPSAEKFSSPPTSAEVVDIPAAQAQLGIKAGNTKVTFSDGHTEVITNGGNCMYPRVSTRGDGLGSLYLFRSQRLCAE